MRRELSAPATGDFFNALSLPEVGQRLSTIEFQAIVDDVKKPFDGFGEEGEERAGRRQPPVMQGCDPLESLAEVGAANWCVSSVTFDLTFRATREYKACRATVAIQQRLGLDSRMCARRLFHVAEQQPSLSVFAEASIRSREENSPLDRLKHRNTDLSLSLAV